MKKLEPLIGSLLTLWTGCKNVINYENSQFMAVIDVILPTSPQCNGLLRCVHLTT